MQFLFIKTNLIYSAGLVMLCINPAHVFSRGGIPTPRECSIDRSDLSPNLTARGSSGLLWHRWLARPRPPTATHPVSSNRPASTRCSRAPCAPIGRSSAHTRPRLAECCHPRVRVVRFVFLFFFFFSASLCFTHTAERKGSQSQRSDLNPAPAQATALATAVSLFCTGCDSDKKSPI